MISASLGPQWMSDSHGVSQLHSSPGSANCTRLQRPRLSPASMLAVINCAEDAPFVWTKQRLRVSSQLGTASAAHPWVRRSSVSWPPFIPGVLLSMGCEEVIKCYQLFP